MDLTNRPQPDAVDLTKLKEVYRVNLDSFTEKLSTLTNGATTSSSNVGRPRRRAKSGTKSIKREGAGLPRPAIRSSMR
jgi:hypothetical protein